MAVDVNTTKEEATMMPRNGKTSPPRSGKTRTRAGEPMRKCRHPECETLVMPNNKTGCCSDHWHWGARGEGAPGKSTAASKTEKAPGARKHKKVPISQVPTSDHYTVLAGGRAGEIPKGNGAESVNVAVPITSLDNWWMRQQSSVKATLFSNWLQGNEA